MVQCGTFGQSQFRRRRFRYEGLLLAFPLRQVAYYVTCMQRGVRYGVGVLIQVALYVTCTQQGA